MESQALGGEALVSIAAAAADSAQRCEGRRSPFLIL